MKLKDAFKDECFRIVTGESLMDEKEVNGVYISDLLSDVIGKSKEDQIWLTIQGHSNIIAVAVLKELSAVVLCGDNHFNSGAINKAKEENVVLVQSSSPIYETALLISKEIYK